MAGETFPFFLANRDSNLQRSREIKFLNTEGRLKDSTTSRNDLSKGGQMWHEECVCVRAFVSVSLLTVL